MIEFFNGVKLDTQTGIVKIYVNKPKEIKDCLINKGVYLDGIKFEIDEFKNSRGTKMLCFTTKVSCYMSYLRTYCIQLREKCTNYTNKLKCDIQNQ